MSYRPQTWKAVQWDYDFLSSIDDRDCCVCLSRRSMYMILAMTDSAHWTTRYFSDAFSSVDPNTIDEWASKLEGQIVAGLDNCCGGGYTTRINSDGAFQISYDGGATWTNAPDLDPRNNSTVFQPLPLAEGEVTRCAAAENIVAILDEMTSQLATQLTAGASLLEIVAVLLAMIAIFLSGGALAPIITGFAGALIGFGGAAITAAFTSDVWDLVLCAIFENISDDGSISQSQLDDIYSDLDADLDGAAIVILGDWFNALGPVGMTNAGRTGNSSGTGCEECCVPENVPYATTGDDWSGGAEANNGGCGFGRYIGASGNPATFTIPDRDDRLVAAVRVPACDSTLGTSPAVTVTVGGQASEEGAQPINVGTVHTFLPPVDSSSVVISVEAGLDIFINTMSIDYEC